MNPMFNRQDALKRAGLYFGMIVTVFYVTNCNQAADPVTVPAKADLPAASGFPEAREAQPPVLATESVGLAKTAGTATYLHFGDRTSCTWAPNPCQNSFAIWPGYIQSTGYNEWGYVWMSDGPGTPAIPYSRSTTVSESAKHYHIDGLYNPAIEPNPRATFMYGTDWIYVFMQRSGVGQINFDLMQINVLGTVPVNIYYKDAAGGWWQWASLAPGRWNTLAYNIREVHISSASHSKYDRPIIDDIQVKGL
jgi:hypothetical protein